MSLYFVLGPLVCSSTPKGVHQRSHRPLFIAQRLKGETGWDGFVANPCLMHNQLLNPRLMHQR